MVFLAWLVLRFARLQLPSARTRLALARLHLSCASLVSSRPYTSLVNMYCGEQVFGGARWCGRSGPWRPTALSSKSKLPFNPWDCGQQRWSMESWITSATTSLNDKSGRMRLRLGEMRMRLRLGSHREELRLAPLPSPLTRLFSHYFYESKYKSRQRSSSNLFLEVPAFYDSRLPSRGH